MTTWAEHEPTFGIAEQIVFGGYGNGVGGWFLFGESYHEVCSGLLFNLRNGLAEFLVEQLPVVGGYCEVHVDHTVGVHCHFGGFAELLFHCGGIAGRIAVELEERFGKGSVVQSFGEYDGGDNVLVAVFGQQLVDCFAVQASDGFGEVGEKCELMDVGEKLFHVAAWCGDGLCGVDECEKLLEHARCRAGGRYEFEYFSAVGEIFFPAGESLSGSLFVDCEYAFVVGGCGTDDAQVWEAVAEVGKLFFQSGFADSFFLEEIQVGLG